MTDAAAQSPYRGSLKHKARPSQGRKGTLCPEWTHRSQTGKALGSDPFKHPWTETVAHQLFMSGDTDPAEPGVRFATQNGVAFAAKPTNDGTWHGYPVPWEQVPATLKDKWIDEGRVTKKQVRQYLSVKEKDYRWPLETDD